MHRAQTRLADSLLKRPLETTRRRALLVSARVTWAVPERREGTRKRTLAQPTNKIVAGQSITNSVPLQRVDCLFQNLKR